MQLKIDELFRAVRGVQNAFINREDWGEEDFNRPERAIRRNRCACSSVPARPSISENQPTTRHRFPGGHASHPLPPLLLYFAQSEIKPSATGPFWVDLAPNAGPTFPKSSVRAPRRLSRPIPLSINIVNYPAAEAAFWRAVAFSILSVLNRNTIRIPRMFVTVLMTSCHVSLQRNNGPVAFTRRNTGTVGDALRQVSKEVVSATHATVLNGVPTRPGYGCELAT